VAHRADGKMEAVAIPNVLAEQIQPAPAEALNIQ
jgi:hypothetical protein